MSDLRVACIGAGYFSQFHVESWRQMDGVQPVGMCDLDPEKAAQTGFPAFGDLTQMLESTRPDILDIILPPSAHRWAIAQALEAGVPTIICQKPFCADLEEAREMVAVAKAAGSLLIVHENFRFQPWYRALKSALEAGAVGEVHQMAFRLRPGDGQGPRAYLDRQPYFQQMQRFLVHETAVHWIDTFRYLFGAPTAVYADLRRRNPAIAGEDAGVILFDHANGVQSLFDGNRHLDHAATNTRCTLGEALVEGTGGAITLRGDGSLWLRTHGAMDAQELFAAQDWQGFGGGCVHAFQQHVRDAVRDDGPVETEARDYLQVLEIEAAIYRSAAEQRRVELG